MKQAWWLLILSCRLASGQDLTKTLHGIEERYNNLKTLTVKFTETLTDRGGRHKPSSGTLFLRKPGRMRWEYTAPPGQLFVSDNDYYYDYDPTANRVERCKPKEGDDLRGPLAFLLGKVDFDRDFGTYRTGGADGAITATPKNANLPYDEVTLVPGPDFTLRKLSVKGKDGSVLDYSFDGEVKNPVLADNLFKFTKPAGSVMVDCPKP